MVTIMLGKSAIGILVFLTTRINRPHFPNTAVDISVSSNNLCRSLLCSVHGVPHGSDNFPLIVEHVAKFSLITFFCDTI